MHVSHLDAGGATAGEEPLTLLCRCAPAHSNDDTVLTGG
jgi:hypothetical protein